MAQDNFVKVTATIELDDGTLVQFLSANRDAITIEASRLEDDTVAIGMTLLRSAVELYEQTAQRPEIIDAGAFFEVGTSLKIGRWG